MGNQHIHAVRNLFIELLLASGTSVLHKHGVPIECHAVYLHRTVAQIMAIGVKSVNDGPIQARAGKRRGSPPRNSYGHREER